MEEDSMFPYEDACPCLVCRDIRIDALLSEDGYAHHESCAALKSAAIKGCRLCFMIMRSLLLRYKLLSREDDDEQLLHRISEESFLGHRKDFNVTLQLPETAGPDNPSLSIETDRLLITLGDPPTYHNRKNCLGCAVHQISGEPHERYALGLCTDSSEEFFVSV
jgi:hypothetical protein